MNLQINASPRLNISLWISACDYQGLFLKRQPIRQINRQVKCNFLNCFARSGCFLIKFDLTSAFTFWYCSTNSASRTYNSSNLGIPKRHGNQSSPTLSLGTNIFVAVCLYDSNQALRVEPSPRLQLEHSRLYKNCYKHLGVYIRYSSWMHQAKGVKKFTLTS